MGTGPHARLLDLPFLDLADPAVSTRGPEVAAARARSWCARTPFGLAVLRHRDVGLLLRDKRLRQGSHAWPDTQGLRGSFADFWKRSIISQEGEPHKALRHLAIPVLAPEFIASLVPGFDAAAADLADALVRRGSAEFMHAFAEPFSGRAICLVLGLPEEMAGRVAADASALGLAMGIGAKGYEPRFNAATDRLNALADTLLDRGRATRDAATFGGRLIDRAEALGITDTQVLNDLVVISIFGGVDTTRAQLGHAVTLFIAHPGEWDKLRADPGLVPNAVEEIIRAFPTTTWATREAVCDFTHNGVAIAKGEILHMLVNASGTDPAVVEDARFDVAARRKGHWGFGGGAHHCLGQLVARTDIACALRTLVARVARWHFDGEAAFLPDSGNTSPLHLPIRVDAG